MKRATIVIVLMFVSTLSGLAQESVAPATADGPDAIQKTISVASLLDELVDLYRLTKFPDPAYVTKQFSSYDRKSKSPDEDWFANGDFNQFVRIEKRQGRNEHVMMDAAGPGAIVRIWSANPAGTLRIYVDGNDTPVIEAAMKQLLGGKVEGFPVPIAGKRARGWNLYFPIPYAKQCKVTSDQGGFYYHVNYRTYGPGTRVKSFVPTDLDDQLAKIKEIAHKLASPRKRCRAPVGRQMGTFDKTFVADSQDTLYETRGTKAICRFLVSLEADDVDSAARGVVLEMRFDGEKTIETPIGDFFGVAPGMIPYESLPLGITEGERPQMWCHWWMPFSRTAKIAIRNLTDQKVRVYGVVSTVAYEWDDASLLFHAKWRTERDIPSRPHRDWTHLECTGQGRFVGGALHIINPVRNWWGEGDEKIYVDGETFPSHFGTGTEDYYGYAWCSPARFVHAYHNQPKCDGPKNYGNTSVNRFHVIDDIPFTRSFKFDMESFHLREGVKTTRAAISYWYGRPGGSDFFQLISKQDVQPVVVPPYQVTRVLGALEAEDLPAVVTHGTTQRQTADERFSNGAQLFWSTRQPGAKLTLVFDMEKAGPKHVIARFVQHRLYGQVQAYINGAKAGDVIDLKGMPVRPMKEIDLGRFELKEGQNELVIEAIRPAKQEGKYNLGLDYIRLK